jgi:hypothetical protein
LSNATDCPALALDRARFWKKRRIVGHADVKKRGSSILRISQMAECARALAGTQSRHVRDFPRDEELLLPQIQIKLLLSHRARDTNDK